MDLCLYHTPMGSPKAVAVEGAKKAKNWGIDNPSISDTILVTIPVTIPVLANLHIRQSSLQPCNAFMVG
jgi:hypothetical protein